MSSLARGFVFVRCCAGGRRRCMRPGACSEGSFAGGGVMIRGDCVSKCGYFLVRDVRFVRRHGPSEESAQRDHAYSLRA